MRRAKFVMIFPSARCRPLVAEHTGGHALGIHGPMLKHAGRRIGVNRQGYPKSTLAVFFRVTDNSAMQRWVKSTVIVSS